MRDLRGLFILLGVYSAAAAFFTAPGIHPVARRCAAPELPLVRRGGRPEAQMLAAEPRTSGHLHTAESRAKISAANKGKTPWNRGRKHTEETRRKIAEGTRRALQQRAEQQRLERERLRVEEPEGYAALLQEEAARTVAKAVSAEARRERKAKAARTAARKAMAAAREKEAPQGGPAARVRHARVTTGPGGRVNFTFTEEAKAKISASLKKRWQDPAYR